MLVSTISFICPNFFVQRGSAAQTARRADWKGSLRSLLEALKLSADQFIKSIMASEMIRIDNK